MMTRERHDDRIALFAQLSILPYEIHALTHPSLGRGMALHNGFAFAFVEGADCQQSRGRTVVEPKE